MKKQVTRAQSSVEFLIVTGIGLLLLTGVAAVYLNYTKTSGDNVRIQQVSGIASTILGEAARVYGIGANAWVTVEVNMPDNVQAIYVTEGNALVFDVGTINGLVSQPVFSNTPIDGINVVGSKAFVNSGAIVIHSGPTRFRITSQGTNVTIAAVT